MEDLNDVLKPKTIHANNLEFFVFLPNDLNKGKFIIRNENENFRNAIAAKTAGNTSFQEKQYDVAINNYSAAIEMFESMDEDLYDIELAVCYQNRAAAKEYMKNLYGSISDATKAIELNGYYSKAYFRRAKAYYQLTHFYRALQDIVQACILERFKNETYTKMVGNIIAKIDWDPLEDQWQNAYVEMDADKLHCDHCMRSQMIFVKNCGIFDALSVPIPKNQAAIGYTRAMIGVNELNVDKIMGGCKEEEAIKGKHLAQSYIMRAYMNSLVLSPSNFQKESSKDLRHLKEIISDVKSPENIKFHAILCRANFYNRIHQFGDAKRDLKSIEKKYKNSGLFHVIKSGALLQLSQSNAEFIEPLSTCCKLLPNVFELHYQRAIAITNCLSNKIVRTAARVVEFEQLISKFPKELLPRVCLAGIYAKLDDTHKAKKILKKAKKDFPNCLDEISCVYGMLRPTHSSCVQHFKRSLEYNKDDPGSLYGLLNYFSSTTYEYAKAIEVSTRALYSFLQVQDFKDMFQHRQTLLKRIVLQDYWDQL